METISEEIKRRYVFDAKFHMKVDIVIARMEAESGIRLTVLQREIAIIWCGATIVCTERGDDGCG